MGRDQADRQRLTLLRFRLAVRFPTLLLGRRDALTGCRTQNTLLPWSRRCCGSRSGLPGVGGNLIAQLMRDMRNLLEYFVTLPLQMSQGVTEYVNVFGICRFSGSSHNYS